MEVGEIGSVPNELIRDTSSALTLSEFLGSKEFQRQRDSVNRFLALLSWLHLTHADQFADAAFGFRRRKRVYFAKSKKEIVRSGESIGARPIPRSSYWALTTMSNEYKRIILEYLLQALGYLRGEIDFALAALPDSNIRRNGRRTGSAVSTQFNPIWNT